MTAIYAESTTKLTHVGELLHPPLVQLECRLQQCGNPTQTLKTSSISRLPLHIEEGEVESP